MSQTMSIVVTLRPTGRDITLVAPNGQGEDIIERIAFPQDPDELIALIRRCLRIRQLADTYTAAGMTIGQAVRRAAIETWEAGLSQ